MDVQETKDSGISEKVKTLEEDYAEKLSAWMEELFTRYIEENLGKNRCLDKLIPAASDMQEYEKYQFYFRRFELTEKMKSDLAMVIARDFLSIVSPTDVFVSMISNPAVLVSDEKSAFWLHPIAFANRTSIAYERGLALERCGMHSAAQTVMEAAAVNGDADCARCLGESANIDNECEIYIRTQTTDIIHKSENLPLPPVTTSFSCAKACIAWKEYARAEKILQKAADEGDVACALCLIRQTLIHEMTQSLREEAYGEEDYDMPF